LSKNVNTRLKYGFFHRIATFLQFFLTAPESPNLTQKLNSKNHHYFNPFKIFQTNQQNPVKPINKDHKITFEKREKESTEGKERTDKPKKYPKCPCRMRQRGTSQKRKPGTGVT
jgi:hypothetical protein